MIAWVSLLVGIVELVLSGLNLKFWWNKKQNNVKGRGYNLLYAFIWLFVATINLTRN